VPIALSRVSVPVLAVSVMAVALGAAPVSAQPAAPAAALKKALEGREVMVLIDMPATSAGVDLHLQREPEMNFAEHGRRMKDFGTALRKEDRVMITLVKVNKKNIEVQLAGGGYGTWGDESGYVAPAYVGKSRRETDLEKERKDASPERRRDIDRELNYLREDRNREERAAQREAAALTAIKQREVADKRLGAGSRFNIWYPDKRLEQWVPTAEELILSLSAYLDFGDGRNGDGVPGVMRGTAGNRLVDQGQTQLGPARLRSVEMQATSLRRGMSTDEVHDLLGTPTKRRSSKQGDLEAVVETWETAESTTEVTFVGGVVVKFTSSSK